MISIVNLHTTATNLDVAFLFTIKYLCCLNGPMHCDKHCLLKLIRVQMSHKESNCHTDQRGGSKQTHTPSSTKLFIE
jgi:hypothetical protein